MFGTWGHYPAFKEPLALASVKEILTGIDAKIEEEIEDTPYLFIQQVKHTFFTISAFCPLGKAIDENFRRVPGTVFMGTLTDGTVIPVRLIGAKDIFKMPKFYDVRMTVFDLSFEPIDNLDFYMGLAVQRDWITKYLPKKKVEPTTEKPNDSSTQAV